MKCAPVAKMLRQEWTTSIIVRCHLSDLSIGFVSCENTDVVHSSALWNSDSCSLSRCVRPTTWRLWYLLALVQLQMQYLCGYEHWCNKDDWTIFSEQEAKGMQFLPIDVHSRMRSTFFCWDSENKMYKYKYRSEMFWSCGI